MAHLVCQSAHYRLIHFHTFPGIKRSSVGKRGHRHRQSIGQLRREDGWYHLTGIYVDFRDEQQRRQNGEFALRGEVVNKMVLFNLK